MSRWINETYAPDVLNAADAWRERCFLKDTSLFTDEPLWTLGNIAGLKQRFVDNPIEGADRDFYDKLKQQVSESSSEVIRLAAEVIWFYLLVAHHSHFGPEKKREQIRTVWEWSGSKLPDSPFLKDTALMGVANPGTAYLTRRFDQIAFFLEVIERFKNLAQDQRSDLVAQDVPWTFVKWLDAIPNADRRPIRNAILYFLFPDHLERNLSNDHRRQIVSAFRTKLPPALRPKSATPSLIECDRAISEIRKVFEHELGKKEVDFYEAPIYERWFGGLRDKTRAQIAAELTKLLADYNLELRQCGSKKKSIFECYELNEHTGYWTDPNDATNKPLRWLLHLELTANRVLAKLPGQHGDRRIAFANTAQGNSGAVTIRIVPAIRLADAKYAFYEAWEWTLLFCFLPALEVGSSGQLFDDFDPATGRLMYKGKPQPYIYAALVGLCDEDDEFTAPELSRPMRYSEATEAIGQLIRIEPLDRTAPVIRLRKAEIV
jgi:hypothetical protein